MGHSHDKKFTPLHDLLFQEIENRESASLSFAEFMDICLYHEDLGYYADPTARKIGRSGDFFTSVSVGDTFGLLLARDIRRNFGDGERFAIVEQGAHDGQLALDIMVALDDLGVENLEGYFIVEPREKIRANLGKKIESTGYVRRINPVGSFAEVGPFDTGIFLANELLDAIPVHRVIFEEGNWKELRVTVNRGGFAWLPSAIESGSRLEFETNRFGTNFPEGYTTEVCLALESWASGLLGLFRERGVFRVIDYGLEEADYLAPHRTSGTLQCYRNHRKSENPFELPGETDLTAHVNFSHLQRAAESAGFRNFRLTDQHHFLVHAAEDWLREIDGQPPDSAGAKRLRQFQTLIHPTMMGRSFQVAEFEKIG
ncbi:MAG: hypothetical protein HKN23_04465 [Verrucomicrobiales bacterium]|nr:hypothetical protein [Verrucomicrobiales bacterium]